MARSYQVSFLLGHKLDPISANQIPANVIGRLLDDGDGMNIACEAMPFSLGTSSP